MAIKINPEYFRRHAFVTVLMLGMSVWFGYDGFIRYPATPAADLYRSIEGSEAREGYDVEAFKAQKTKTQYGFTLLTFLAALVIGARLYRSYRFRLEFDDGGFTANDKRYAFDDIVKVDRSRWKKKSIVTLTLSDSTRLTLDAWHHLGVKEFLAHLPIALR